MSETTNIEWATAVKRRARKRTNNAVLWGRIPDPNTVPCVDCGHIWKAGERRHEYDHHKGYAPENHLTVEAVCTLCHSKRDGAKTNQTSCVHGHPFTPENTGNKTNGTRFCRECRREFDRRRTKTQRTAAYWREYREQRRVA